jgi:hypothetical protein
MRAGYAAVALAAVLVTLVGSAVMSAGPAPPSTLAMALGLDAPGSGAILDRRREAAIASRTADCMAALGLVYEPVPGPPPRIPDADLDPVAWSARWGFGVSTSAAWSRGQPDPDPNAAYAAGLPPAMRDRYQAALYGNAAEPGCHATATDRVLGLRQRVLAPLRPDLDALQREVEADPSVRAATTTWRRCIVGATRDAWHRTFGAAGRGTSRRDGRRSLRVRVFGCPGTGRGPARGAVRATALAASARDRPGHP